MSRNRQISLAAVAVLHVLLGYAVINGFAIKVIKKIVEPIEAVNVKEEAPPPEEPPPPPPKEIEIPPYVPPPEVSVQSDAAPTITTQSTAPRPEPPVYTPPAPPAPPAPAPVAAPTPATPKGRGNVISTDDYPSASRAAEEEGVVRVSYTIGTDGRVTECTIAQSSGFKRLDDATCSIIQRRWRFNPASRDGQPVAERKTQPVRWKLEN
ncbi:MAG: TonB family protein [Sphingomonadales bacterium]|jgi:protein TonB